LMSAGSWRREWPGLLPALVVAAVALAVPPTGEFPCNDDWDYHGAVGELLAYREIRFTDWPSASLIAQLVWGAGFSLAFGFSYFALRLSTLTAAAIAGMVV
jgi:hypothetical protein